MAGQSEWSTTPIGARLRLVGGEVPGDTAATPRIIVGLNIELPQGWKTYWRSPGDGGGVPPLVTWEDSRNIQSGTLQFPAPERFKDAAGDSIGYHDQTTLLVELIPKDVTRPIELHAGIFIGVCKDICVPVDTTLSLNLAPGERPSAEEAAILQRALNAVPQPEQKAGAELAIGDIRATYAGATPEIEIATKLPVGTGKADLFVEAEDGSFVPLPATVQPSQQGPTLFRIDLSRATRAEALAGKPIVLTLVTDRGSMEARRTLPK